ncbi:redoxin domain-containing protein [Roseiconus nitratireducens]|uniref:Redoxin domain-containing protein n=1 Tax=Roseiconus nitratireducens TaxID=2605748 RepID=A0A5M6D8N1_9BACT|nr:TlpA disulfide reductase family protein [Roseiconus nitratireducens]KAA5543877.1 redoxin domain-containing protein [Roseiconus nitratireducens]
MTDRFLSSLSAHAAPLRHRSSARGPLRMLAAGALALAAPLAGTSAHAKTPSPAAALSLKPVQQDATYETVPEELVDKCTVADIERAGMNGWEVTGPDGVLLRRFADTNGDKRIDLWSYFNYGVEAYRDVDSDFNGKADQYRWLGNAGTRWGIDQNEDGRIDQWKRISPEEVSAEVVAAVREGDTRRFVTLLATPDELRSLELGKAKTEELAVKTKRAASEFADLAQRQTAVSPRASWVQFAAPKPGLVPEGTDGSGRDVVVYENVVAMFEDEGQSGQLMVGTLVQVGDAWRMIDLPGISNDGTAMAQSTGVFFTSGSASMNALGGNVSDELQTLVTQLESIDKQLAAGNDSQAAKLHAARADVVEKLIEGSQTAEDRATWTRQLIDTVSVAVQSRAYPDGLSRLKRVAGQFAADDAAMAAYADYQTIQAEYVVRQTPDADFEKVQNWYLDSLAEFVDRHPGTIQAAQAMLQLALSKEFEDNEDEALAYYKKVRDGFKGTEPGEKAAGAVRRLESVGRRIELEGTTIEGKSFQLSQLRGRPVIVHYWATWCEPCKQDMKLLSRLQARYGRAGLQLVGVNVDARRADAEAYLQQNRLPWVQLFEEGGLESSPLSKAFGVQTLPTMMLIDREGKVVRHNIRKEELDAELDELLSAK